MCRVLALLALGACSFRGADVVLDASSRDVGAIDAAVVGDGATDTGTASLTCLEKWQQHVVVLGAPVPLTTINSIVMDRDVWVSLDEQTLYLAQYHGGDADVYVSTFDTSVGQWRTPAVTSIAFPGTNESKLSMAADGVTAAVSVLAVDGDFDVQLWSRTNGDTNFTYVSSVSVASQGANDYDPYLTPDGKRLYWAPDGPSTTPQQIALATRGNTNASFGNVQMLTELGTGVSDPAPSFDETVMLYSVNQTGTIHYATRATGTGPFTPAGLVPTINIATQQADPHLSKDACHLYFARYSAITDWDLYMSTVQ